MVICKARRELRSGWYWKYGRQQAQEATPQIAVFQLPLAVLASGCFTIDEEALALDFLVPF